MSTIENYKINPISLLNEISTKIKKRVDYAMTESPYGKIRVYSFIPTFNGLDLNVFANWIRKH